MSGKYIPITKKGYSLFEVSSALQKSIRRGLERDALYWGWELELSNYGKYFWKRMVIIAVEDIGPATQDAHLHVLNYQKAYEDLKKRKAHETSLMIAAAVVYLCRCPKSRLYDWVKCWMIDTHDHRNLKVPDYALDVHTRRGKQMGRTVDDFFETGCIIEPHKVAQGETEYRETMREFYCETSPGARAAKESCKVLPDEHPDRLGKFKKPLSDKQQIELFEDL
ncbi:hypothetical protein [Ruficoccus sp. ZRK36]|uniref:AAA family ATPase n=1 Tax=Ruficoccus sp. ZRK36 TaxID=2866311 RepID=UPI001C732566|nr:hypothetical protein [Ruficoccus sp. ZRK36]QYY34995.1 hypothetical protein K0V07_11865 [Ruficoccus sp. ZRK36]